MRFVLFAFLAGVAFCASAPEPQKVYVLPMTGGLDQYLANRLASAGLFRVVTDPKLADVVFTDQIGANFEQKLNDLLPALKAEDEGENNNSKDDSRPPLRAYTSNRLRSTVFLVDLKSRAVVWSSYEKPIRSTPASLDKEAVRIVRQIQKDRKTAAE